MLDFSAFTTKKGAKIEFCFEDPSIKSIFSDEFSQEEVQDVLHKVISKRKKDTGEGTVVYVVINSQIFSKVFTEKQYLKWNAKPEKDWFHEEIEMPEIVIHVIDLSPESEFVGVNSEEFEEFVFEENKIELALAVHRANPDDCSFCILPGCPGRNKSFDKQAFEEAIANIKI